MEIRLLTLRRLVDALCYPTRERGQRVFLDTEGQVAHLQGAQDIAIAEDFLPFALKVLLKVREIGTKVLVFRIENDFHKLRIENCKGKTRMAMFPTDSFLQTYEKNAACTPILPDLLHFPFPLPPVFPVEYPRSLHSAAIPTPLRAGKKRRAAPP